MASVSAGALDTCRKILPSLHGEERRRYDEFMRRLTSASKPGTTAGYTYDANGNRLAQTGTSASTYAVVATSNRLTSTTGALARTYGYDTAGNTTSFTGITFAYSNRGRMKSSTRSEGV
jgi:YD repeat-containing protein